MAVVRKLKRVLKERFPPPDKIDLRDDDGIIGVVTSKDFRDMDTLQRQDLIHELLTTHLTREEQRHVLMLVALTPEEELANAADD
jgi:stress-induced morphogen